MDAIDAADATATFPPAGLKVGDVITYGGSPERTITSVTLTPRRVAIDYAEDFPGVFGAMNFAYQDDAIRLVRRTDGETS